MIQPARLFVFVLSSLALLAGCATRSGQPVTSGVDSATGSQVEIGRVLDDWHAAAARADFDRYFSHFTPDAVFMGTDATERWSVAEFSAYARPHFDKGSAWSFTPHDRRIIVAASGDTAWFDEELATPHLGPCRGSGVLTRAGRDWKIAHYNLSIPLPNDLAKDIVKMIADRQPSSTTTPAGAPPPAHLPDALNVMSFNIRYDNPGDGPDAWPRRRDMVADFLLTRRPDIVGLQEVLHSQLQDLLQRRPEFAHVGVGRDDGRERGEYAPILYRSSRFDLLDSGTFWLSDTPETPGSTSWGNSITRICTWARFTDRLASSSTPAVTLCVYNLHLDHISQPSRERGVRLLLDRIRLRSHADPVIITGDFNAGEQNPAILALIAPDSSAATSASPPFVDTFRQLHAHDTDVGTFNAFKGHSTGDKIDFVLVQPSFRTLEASIHRDHSSGRYLSDHFPVSARILLPR